MKRLFLLLLVAGCVSHKTGETEVGVLVCKIGVGCEGKGVQTATYPPGSTTFFLPFIRDFYTFDTKIQNLEMVRDSKRGDRAAADDLQFKTTDGNDISMDVTVVWQIDPKKAPEVLQNVGTSTQEVKERLVRPMARTLVRDVLNELDSESIYNADKRFQKAEEAKATLQKGLQPYGVMVSNVILAEFRFNPEYDKVIHARKLAEQHAVQLQSETKAATQEAERNLQTAKGQVAAQVAAADGELKQAQLAADAALYQQQQNAEAILTERSANAQAIQKKNEALRGSGGRAMVKIKIAEALNGKAIVLIPGGASGVGLNKLDVNQLIESVIAGEAREDKK
jgi:regulator of protease activity HflC (stomatin/prohibitin superfamily)